jgi:ubiquinone/menaquinone biosynthesis C-methylase UbiE
MFLYKYPLVHELIFKFPPALIWRRKAIKLLEKELKGLDLKPEKILDVGCGVGILASTLRKIYPKSEILGIDVSSSMVNIAKKRYGNIALFRNLDFLDFKGKQDLIIIFHSFTFFKLLEIVCKIKEILKPGGACIIATNTEAPFSLIHKFILSRFLRTEIRIYSPIDFYELFPETEWTINSMVISQSEGSFILSIRNEK